MVYWHISRISYRFGVIRHFILADNLLPIPDHFRGVFRVKTPEFYNYTFHILKESVFWANMRENWLTCIGCSSVEELKKTKQKSLDPYMLLPRGVSTAHRIRTNFVRAGNLPNLITHAKFQINWYKVVTLAKFYVLALLRRTPLTRLSPAGLPVIIHVLTTWLSEWEPPNSIHLSDEVSFVDLTSSHSWDLFVFLSFSFFLILNEHIG